MKIAFEASLVPSGHSFHAKIVDGALCLPEILRDFTDEHDIQTAEEFICRLSESTVSVAMFLDWPPTAVESATEELCGLLRGYVRADALRPANARTGTSTGIAFWQEAASDSNEVSWISGEHAISLRRDRTVGQVIADRYHIDAIIGEGGMSRVYSAFDRLKSRRVALKVVSLEGKDRARLERRFKLEVEIAEQLKGPAFVPMYDYGLRLEYAYIAMELLEGESLQERLARIGRMEPCDALNMLRGIAGGIHAAHDLCVVHRDLKPSNIFFARHPDGETVRLLDFGIAKDLWTAGAKITRVGSMVGSPHYASPEQARCQDVDPRSDLWSIGVILYRCLTGVRPFDGAIPTLVIKIVTEKHPPASRGRELPPGIDAFFDRALAKRAEDRFQDIHELLAAFEATVDGWRESERIKHPSPDLSVQSAIRPNRISERTQPAGIGYDDYVARTTRNSASVIPTMEVPSPFADAAARPSPTPPDYGPFATRATKTLAPSPWTQHLHPPERLPKRRLPPEVLALIAVLLLLILLMLWIVFLR